MEDTVAMATSNDIILGSSHAVPHLSRYMLLMILIQVNVVYLLQYNSVIYDINTGKCAIFVTIYFCYWLECLHSEDTTHPATYPMSTHTIDSYWIPIQNKRKSIQNKTKSKLQT